MSVRHDLGNSCLTAVGRDFLEHGAGFVADLRRADRAHYLRLVASLLPDDFNPPQQGPHSQLSDEELHRRLVAAVAEIYADRRELLFSLLEHLWAAASGGAPQGQSAAALSPPGAARSPDDEQPAVQASAAAP
jgi:hypothetical protein